MAKITLYVPDQEPFKLGLEGAERITVGRAPENDIVLDHASISGTHAVISLSDGRYHVTDQESTNGTFVEGTAINAPTPLGAGMKILFGEVEADFEGDEAPAAAQEQTQAAAEEASGEASFSTGGAGLQASGWEPAAESARPKSFKDLSPIEKVEKKDSLGQIAMILGIVGILVAIGLVIMSLSMKV